MWLPRPKYPSSTEERAVSWIVSNHDMSYAQVAALFGVSVNSIRSRIEYRYGSLTEARQATQHPPETKTTRRCIICKKEHDMDRNQYVCQPCRRNIAEIE